MRLSSTCRMRDGSPSITGRSGVRLASTSAPRSTAAETASRTSGSGSTSSAWIDATATSATMRSTARQAEVESRTSSSRAPSSSSASENVSAIAASAATGLRTSCTRTARRSASRPWVIRLAPPCGRRPRKQRRPRSDHRTPHGAARSAGVTSPPRCRPRSTRYGATSAGRFAARRAGRTPSRARLRHGRASRRARPWRCAPCSRRAPRRRLSTPRFHGQTSWQMSHPYTMSPTSTR